MKRILPVAVLFAVLLALVIVRETSRARTDGGASDGTDFVPLAVAKFAVKDVAKVEVTAPGENEPEFVVERQGERWLVTKPFRAPAHVGNVEKLCDALASGDAELRADDAGSLRDLDLDADRSVAVRVTDASGKVLSHVAVGRNTGSRGAFVRLLAEGPATRALETTTDLRGLLGLARSGGRDAEPERPEASHFRDREFPAVKLEDPRRVEVTAPGRRVVLERKDGSWTAVEGGPGLPVNAQGVDRMIEKFGAQFRPKDLADPSDLAKLGLATPSHVVAVTLADGTTRRVFGGGDPAKDAWYVRLDAPQDPDVVWEATSFEFQQLFPVGSGLFTFDDTGVAEDRCTRFVLESGATRVEMVRDGTKASDDWKLVAPDWPLVPRQGSLRSLVTLARGMKAVDWTDGAQLAAGEATIRLGPRDAPEADLASVRIGGRAPSGKDRLAVFSRHPDRVVVVADSTVDRLIVSPTSLFEPKVLHGWTDADVKAVRVDAQGAALPAFAVERKPDGWTLVQGEERRDANSDAVKSWIGALLGLETREPVASARPAEARITLEKSDGTSRTIELSASSDPDGRRTVTLGTLVFETDRRDLLPAPASLLVAPPVEKQPEEK
jgi:hypothetical protein